MNKTRGVALILLLNLLGMQISLIALDIIPIEIGLPLWVLLFAYFYKKTKTETVFNMSEDEAYLYNWSKYLLRKKVFSNEQDFDVWMSGFEDRYTERELSIMKFPLK